MSIHPEPDFVRRALRNVQRGLDQARQAGRPGSLDGFLTCSLDQVVESVNNFLASAESEPAVGRGGGRKP